MYWQTLSHWVRRQLQAELPSTICRDQLWTIYLVLAISLTGGCLPRRRRRSTAARLEVLFCRRETLSTPRRFQTPRATFQAPRRPCHWLGQTRAAVRRDQWHQTDHCGGRTPAAAQWKCPTSNSIRSTKDFASPAFAFRLYFRFSVRNQWRMRHPVVSVALLVFRRAKIVLYISAFAIYYDNLYSPLFMYLYIN